MNATNPARREEMIYRAITTLAAPGQVTEVRAFSDTTIASGYYNDPVQMASDIDALSTAGYTGIYVTLNPVRPALLARRANRIKLRLSRTDNTTADHDIISRRWLPIDIDPIRPAGVSSSEEEHTAALKKAETIADFLSFYGFTTPVMADSGNGAHLLYQIDLPNTSEATDLVKQCLSTLDALFSDEICIIDTAVCNASRIWKLYGTVSQKGDSTIDRPHRRASLLCVPEQIVIVKEENLHQLATLLAPEQPASRQSASKKTVKRLEKRKNDKTRTENSPDNLKQWLLSHHLAIASEKPYHGGMLYRLLTCPFSDAHTDGAYIVVFPDGGVLAACHHTSCGAGENRWQELKTRLKADENRDIAMRQQRERQIQRHNKRTGQIQESGENNTDKDTKRAAPFHPDPSIEEKAYDILTTGDPLGYILSVWGHRHSGDLCLGQSLCLSAASRFVRNTKGLHVSVSGASGKGKSDGMHAMLSLLPPDSVLRDRLSDKALYYTDLQPQTVLLLDDMGLSEDLQSVLKEATTSFTRPVTLRTVDKNRKPQILTIPERSVWWVGNVYTAGDEQVMNRMLSVWVDDSPAQDDAVYAMQKKAASRDFEETDTADIDLLVCRRIWEIIGDSLVYVHIPYASRIQMADVTNRRGLILLLDLIRSHAVLNQKQRQFRILSDGGLHITATEEDFTNAVSLFFRLHGSSGCQGEKFSRQESLVLALAAQYEAHEFTYQDVMRWTGRTYRQVQRLIQGYTTKKGEIMGLLDKSSALHEVTESRETQTHNGRLVRRSGKVFIFDLVQYRESRNQGKVWLADDDTITDAFDDDGDDDDDDRDAGKGLVCTPPVFSADGTHEISEYKVPADTTGQGIGSLEGTIIRSIDPPGIEGTCTTGDSRSSCTCPD